MSDRNATAPTDVDPSDALNLESLRAGWWTLAVRGIAAIVFGVLTFLSPFTSMLALILLFGAYAIVDGVVNLATAATGRGRAWGWLVFEGLVSVGAGVVAFAWPGLTALALLSLIAAWSIITGVAEIAMAIRLRKVIRNEWLLASSGALSILFGAVLLLFPLAGSVVLTIWIGAYAVVFGGVLVALAFKLRSWGRAIPWSPPAT
jgi:uncharacterized membrane protein HdeD (DUF308 family)